MGKPVPKLWWDVRWKCFTKGGQMMDAVIVESDDPRYPVIAEWELHPADSNMSAAFLAERLIKDINEGRKSFYDVAKQYKKEK